MRYRTSLVDFAVGDKRDRKIRWLAQQDLSPAFATYTISARQKPSPNTYTKPNITNWTPSCAIPRVLSKHGPRLYTTDNAIRRGPFIPQLKVRQKRSCRRTLLFLCVCVCGPANSKLTRTLQQRITLHWRMTMLRKVELAEMVPSSRNQGLMPSLVPL